MALGKKTGGRQKGSLNKTTQSALVAIELAADALGGTQRLVCLLYTSDAADE